jgi:arylsulfatase
MAVPWAWMFGTPFSWTKQIASHFGGTRQGMAVMWPKRIQDKGGVRHQFHHFIDIVPTILEAASIRQPATVDGIPQSPIEGVSMLYTFDKANETAPTTRKTQYFEMFGDRALYHDGWIASTKVARVPWDVGGGAELNPVEYPWELYDLRNDWTQCDNVASKHPAKLKELQELFWVEAKKYNVLPLDSSVATRFVTPRPSITAGRDVFTWTGPSIGTPAGDAPSLLNTSYAFKAEVDLPKEGTEGMLITEGGRFGGYGFYLLQGKPVFTWNLLGLKSVRWEGAAPLAAGKHVLEFEFKYAGLGAGTLAYGSTSGIGKGGKGTLKVDGKVVNEQEMEHTVPIILPIDESLDVGSDTLTGVDDRDYQVPFEFTGRIIKITLTVDRPKLSEEDKKRLMEAAEKIRSAK